MLTPVRGVDVDSIVVNPDVLVRVSGGEGDLEVGGEEVWGGDVEGEDRGILEDEAGFRRAKDEEYEEDYEEDDKYEG